MHPNLAKILTIFLLINYIPVSSQEIWRESFNIPDKGVWGNNDNSSVKTDFEGISTWTLNYADLSLTDSEDYAKTVTTSGGRFECKDINGVAIWYSQEINISEYKNISIQLEGNETGSGANEENKYLKAFYIIDNGKEQLFETNGENLGNWGQSIVQQTELEGEKLQIVIYMCNHYASDKIILDEVVVMGEEKNPVIIEPGDILLNEVLFNPIDDGADYVEIYNYSEKTIPLNKLYLASRDNDSELTQIYTLTTNKTILQPQSYLALTKDTAGVFPWFTIKCPDCFLQMDKFPSYNNDEDDVVLLNNDLKIIDEFHYDEKMHSPLLYDQEGISLERVSFTSPTNEKSNWHSASTESGYGTPGYENSQVLNMEIEKVSVTFEPEAFSPNNDGYNDIYTIHIQTDKPGYICNTWIYDSSGLLVRKLINNNILGTSDTFSWNGKDENGKNQKLGVYVVLVEIFNTEGYIKQFKDGVVLTKIFK